MAITKNSQIDLNGNEMILDADGDTTITADTDDQIDFKTGGSDRMTIASNGNTTIKSGLSEGGGVLNLENTATGVNGQNWGSVNWISNDTSASASGIRCSIVGTSTSFNGDGNIVFSTAPSNGTNTERLRILNSGGITFNGDTAAANALDDYEEGTWTPTDASGASLSFSTIDKNRYTKIGRFVMAHARIDYPSTSNTSTATVSLPVTPSTDCIASVTGGVVVEQNYDSSVTLTAAVDGTNGARFRINGVGALQNQNLSGKSVRFTVIYISA